MSEPGGPSVTEDRGARLAHLAKLMERVGAGDSAAFEALYEQVSPLVYGTAAKVLRNPDLAAEVTQEVMVKVWRSAATFSPVGGSVPAWIATMAHRRAVDRVRAVQSQRERDARIGVRDYQPPQESVADEVERNLQQQQLQGCLETLTDLQRSAVYSAYYDGFTYREVAERADTGLPTIKSRIRDGLKRLRECLEVLARTGTKIHPVTCWALGRSTPSMTWSGRTLNGPSPAMSSSPPSPAAARNHRQARRDRCPAATRPYPRRRSG